MRVCIGQNKMNHSTNGQRNEQYLNNELITLKLIKRNWENKDERMEKGQTCLVVDSKYMLCHYWSVYLQRLFTLAPPTFVWFCLTKVKSVPIWVKIKWAAFKKSFFSFF